MEARSLLELVRAAARPPDRVTRAASVDDDILRLEVRVNRPPTVRVRQRTGHLSSELHRPGRTQLAALAEQRAQRPGAGRLGDHERAFRTVRVVRKAGVEQRGDVRMHQARGPGRLALESRAQCYVTRDGRVEQLDGHRPIDSAVEPRVHRCAAALAQQLTELVAAREQ
jgi:hypothetical protein